MSITPAVRTKDEIDAIVYGPNFQGWHVRRRNATRKMIGWSNDMVSRQIDALRWQLNHARKVLHVREQKLRPLYALITRLEIQLID